MNSSESLPDLSGELVDSGSLELISLLGKGAYGFVYKARDTTASPLEPRFFAVKCMRRHERKSRADRIQRAELRIHEMASHSPNVVTLHRTFASEDHTFVVLDYVPGGDFFSALVDREVFRHKPTLIKKVFNEILDAVEFLHRNSIYHRDIKPENILCDEHGFNIRLADFGLASQVDFTNEFGCGSRFYMSPESLDRAHPSGCYSASGSDRWALSVLFTNLISGRHPWSSAEMTDYGYAKFCGNNNYLYHALEITREANALLKRCFDPDPSRRATIAQMRASVNEILLFSFNDEPTEVEATPRPGQTAVMPPAVPVKFSAYNVSCSSSASSSYSFVTRSTVSEDDVTNARYSDEYSSPPTTPASSDLDSESALGLGFASLPRLPKPPKQPSLLAMMGMGGRYRKEVPVHVPTHKEFLEARKAEVRRKAGWV
ncbi:Protein kinase domain-containing protein [Mycena chlorophos]|uniref:non-specific serine/threonine protein kinase n=1 Tax=Mycena chlorophos TaxID=658473 RepID=A0A8H6TVB3_MYCCL|nr:Protein kinase domain-containing protein [Mycena chlorophos]